VFETTEEDSHSGDFIPDNNNLPRVEAFRSSFGAGNFTPTDDD
tara:strand:+ start:257 stop:385 length:129 start_codon:yes stop_codon:yes gene_type:complete